MTAQALTYIEIDIPYCANSYGTAPCTASVPTTGAIKCFNSKKTCQDRVHYVEQGATIRFAVASEYLPHEIDAFPSIASPDDITFTPATISLGKDLGTRAVLEIKFTDHPDTDLGTGFDKYLADRVYNPYQQGTFFGKFRARNPFLQGAPLRWIQGTVGQALGVMESRHFVVDQVDGPDAGGVFTVRASDVLRLADDDQSQAPKLSTGYLAADITAVAGTATLQPAGIGNAEYPASGYACIGGNEVVAFTRAADTLTIGRGARGSVANTHKAQDRVQVCLTFDGADAAVIIDTLLVGFTPVSASYLNVTQWQIETAAFLGNVYTVTITEPTGVKTLVSELIEQAGLAVWDDNLNQQVRLQVLRAISTSAFTYTADNRIADSLAVKDQPEQRISRVQVYFGQIDPTQPLTNLNNYRSTSLTIDTQAEADYGAQAIKSITSRWIPALGRSIADRLGAIQLARFRDPPRHIDFSVMRYDGADPLLGLGYQVTGTFLQDATGAPATVPIQVTQVAPLADVFRIAAEEMLFTGVPALTPGIDTLIIDANINNVNLRTAHDSIYPAPSAGAVINVIINAGVAVGSTVPGIPALDVGTWPAGVTVNITNNGTIVGAGGTGGAGASGANVSGSPGGQGSTALYTRQAITLTDASGAIWGGGGGGGGGGPMGGSPTGFGGGGGGGGGAGGGAGGPGGVGAGTAPPSPGATGSNGGGSAGGAGGAGGTGGGVVHTASGGDGGAGGGPGLSGLSGTGGGTTYGPGAGGLPGAAIDGVSHITFSGGHGDIRGNQIN